MTDITKTKADIESLKANLDQLKAQLKTKHPNHCTKCGGVGGVVGTSGDGWNEPVMVDWDDCEDCLGISINPLDTSENLTDEAAEDHAEMMVDGDCSAPLLSKINDLLMEIDLAQEYLAHLEILNSL